MLIAANNPDVQQRVVTGNNKKKSRQLSVWENKLSTNRRKATEETFLAALPLTTSTSYKRALMILKVEPLKHCGIKILYPKYLTLEWGSIFLRPSSLRLGRYPNRCVPTSYYSLAAT